jgi:hypothetical protein
MLPPDFDAVSLILFSTLAALLSIFARFLFIDMTFSGYDVAAAATWRQRR